MAGETSRLGRIGLGHIHREGNRPATGLLAIPDSVAELVAAGDEQHRGALGAEPPRNIATDAPARAGDDAGAALEPEIHQRATM